MDIKFITNDELAAAHFPPLPANKIVPEWYKKLGRYIYPDQEINASFIEQSNNRIPQTIKACVPVQDYITSGYIIRASADLVVTPEEYEGKVVFDWSSNEMLCDSHTHAQCPVKLKGQEHHYFKVKNTWVVKTPLGYSCYYYQPDFFFNENFRFFPGVVDTDMYTEEPVNFVGTLTTKNSFIIKAGDPLMVVFPFKRQDWQHSVELTTAPLTSVTRRVFEKGYLSFFHKQKHYR